MVRKSGKVNETKRKQESYSKKMTELESEQMIPKSSAPCAKHTDTHTHTHTNQM